MKLELQNIYKQFDKKYVLSDVNLSVTTGEVVALIGRNGAGKTTLLKIITGIYNVTSGKIQIDNIDIEKVKENIMYIPDKFDYFKRTKLKDVAKYYELAYENFALDYFRKELEKNKISLNKRVSELSKGQVVIFSVILGLASRTKFLLLDEPLDGIDVINIKLIIDYIIEAQDSGVGVLISSHQLDYLENISDKIIYLGDNDGAIENVDKDNYSKYQLVFEDELPQTLLTSKDIKVLSNIGRVYVVIMRGSTEKTLDIIKKYGVLQYDVLPVLLEDVFVLNSKGGERDV